jgi:transglutaminase-like putative cysteine protease
MTLQNAGMAAVTRQVRVGCEFRYTAEVETAAIFQVQPSVAPPATVLRQGWETTPVADRHGYTDLYGNDCQRLSLPVGDTTLRYDAVVTVPDATEDVDVDAAEVPAAQLPDDALLYTLPSRYCLPDVLGDEAWRLFGNEKPGYRRVRAICDHVHGHLRFDYGSSTPTTTAADAYAAGRGVCRDFAHVAISFCRALSIPARYAFGYLPEMDVPPDPAPMDFAAWMEVYLDGGWWTFDPRNNAARKGRVLIGRGRDAVDVAMVTTYGGPELRSMQVWAEETT